MKIGFIRFPDALYKTGRVAKGGSEVANQQIIDALGEMGEEIIEFSPETNERLELISIPAIGTPLMFQDLYKKIDEINSCDLIVATNWFGLIIPEIKVPQVVIFHSDSKWLRRTTDKKNISDRNILDKWLSKAKKFDLGLLSKQNLHEEVIAIEEEYFCQNADHIVAVSDILMKNLINDYSINNEKISAINNPYDQNWERIAPSKRYDGPLNVVTLTRLPGDQAGFIWKSADRIMEIFSNLKETKNTIVAGVGQADYRDFIKQYVPNTKLVENADREQVASILSGANIAVLVSRWESYGMPLIESMLMGVAPISFPVGIAEEMITNGENGFIVTSTEQAIQTVNKLNENHDLAKKISQNARKTALAKFNSHKIGKSYQDLFKRILD